MARLGSKGDLAAAEIAFFAPSLFLSLFVVFRHGFSRQLGWLYLTILSLLRLIGGSCTIYIDLHNSTNSSLLTAAYICSAVGTAPLLLVLLGSLTRVNDGIDNPDYKMQVMIFRILSLVSLVALILTIVGNDDDDLTYSKVAAIMFLVLYLCEVGITFLLFTRRHAVIPIEKRLIYAGILSIPFLAVRVLYTILVSFKSGDPSSDFYYKDVHVWITAIMQFAMEAIVVIIFVIVGLSVPRRQVTPLPPLRGDATPAVGNGTYPMYGRGPNGRAMKYQPSARFQSDY